MELIGNYNIRQAIADDEIASFVYEPGFIGEIGEKRFVRPNIQRQFFKLTEVLGVDDNPDVYQAITENVPSVISILKEDSRSIFTSRNSLKNLLTVISFDPSIPNERYYVEDKSFKIFISRRGNNLVFNREVHPDSSGIGVDFENKATTSSKEYHQVMACSLNGIQIFMKYEVDGLDQTTMEVIELKTVKVKPMKQYKSQITSPAKYDSSKFYHIQMDKYRLYWIQMNICNLKRMILAKVYENTVVDYDELNDKVLARKAWGNDLKSPQMMITRLGKVLSWVYDLVVEGHEYELSFDGTKNMHHVSLVKVIKPQQTETTRVDELVDSLSTLKLER